MTLPPTHNGTSPVDTRERYLKIDQPPFELDPLVIKARNRLEDELIRPRTPAAGPDAGAALARAREEADRLDRAAEEADGARRAPADVREAAQSGRDALLTARAATRRALDHIEKRSAAGVASAIREAADAVDDARGFVTRAREEAEQADLDVLARALQTPQSRVVKFAGSIRETASAIAIVVAGTAATDNHAAVAGTIPGGQLLTRLRRAADSADSNAALVEGAVGTLSDAARTSAARAATAERRAADAHRTLLELETKAAPDDFGPVTGYASPADELRKFAGRKGIRSQLLSLSELINRSALSEVERLLLSTPGAYERTLLTLLKDQGAPAADTRGLRLAVIGEVNDQARTAFVGYLLDAYRQSRALDVKGDQLRQLRQRLLGEDGDSFLRLAAGRTAKALDTLVDEERREGDLQRYVQQFAARGEIESDRFTDDVRVAMVDYLENLGLTPTQLTPDRVAAGRYDEYFVQAYNFALFGDGRTRPAKLRVVRPSDTDFTMDTFSLAEDQGVVRDHILAAAALYQIYVLGDQLGVYALPTALMLRRARGRLDLSRGTGSQVLQEYKRYLRTAPLLPEDRQLLYRRVFNEGTGAVLDEALANEEFPTLWDALMKEIGEYIRKTEENSSDLEDKISRGPVDEAVRNLQYNLSFFATDIAEDVRDMKEQYELALDVLQDPDVISSVVTGPRQNMWTVIERVLSDDMKRSPNVSALRRLGVEGYKILRYVADFQGPVADEDFKSLVHSGEIWIIAQGALGPTSHDEEPDPQDETDDGAAGEDDWES